MNCKFGLIGILTIVLSTSGCADKSPVQNSFDLYYGRSPKHGVGIALAGGGSKAASYGMGVLAALSDSDDGFKDVEVISTVSGGGYSAFYLYSKWLLQEQLPQESMKPFDKELFADCLPDIYRSYLPNNIQDIWLNTNSDGRFCVEKNPISTKFQQFAKCRQDILENDCDQQLRYQDFEEYGRTILNSVGLVTATLAVVPFNFLSRIVFDWPVNISPSKLAYQEGIGTAYGLYPISNTIFDNVPYLEKLCADGVFLNCQYSKGYAKLAYGKDDELSNYHISFEKLSKYILNNRNTKPTWIINATASPSRSLFDWARKGQRDFSKYTLQMSPFSAHSGFYGDVPNYKTQMDVLQAVTASAAFFDANETSADPPWRMLFAMLQHFFVLDWGQDIRNPNVDDISEVIHGFLPVGLYYLDGLARWMFYSEHNKRSSYIRLLDGGNNDNLGAFTLYEAGVRDMFISDHAQDSKGEMVDMCRLHNEVFLRSNGKKKLLIPGLKEFALQCGAFADDSSCCADNDFKVQVNCEKLRDQLKQNSSIGEYPILAWKYKVLLGCITSSDNPSNECDGDLDARIFLLKPAVNIVEILSQYIDGDKVKEEACKNGSLGECEVAAYLARRIKEKGGIGKFPQDSTVSVTHASSAPIYGAYRELARWHMREAIKIKNEENFSKEIKDQISSPISRSHVKKAIRREDKLYDGRKEK